MNPCKTNAHLFIARVHSDFPDNRVARAKEDDGRRILSLLAFHWSRRYLHFKVGYQAFGKKNRLKENNATIKGESFS